MIELVTSKDEYSCGKNIKIFGVGGAGGNAVNTMMKQDLRGVEFIVANTDINDLNKSMAPLKLQMGKKITKGLGCGANPEMGRKAAEESKEEILHHLEGAEMIFIASGMGGGTGTGAAPYIAQLAKENGILTIGIVNRPFLVEGKKRTVNAEKGIQKLKESVDTLIVIPNEKLKEEYRTVTVWESFKKADFILYEAAKAVSDIINFSGFINVDFADVRTVTQNRGFAIMGTGMAEGENRAVNAANAAMSNPLLSDVDLSNAGGLLINITAGEDFKMEEFEIINKVIVERTGDEGDIITGLVFDNNVDGKIKVTLIATGLETTGTQVYKIEKVKKEIEQGNEDLNDVLKRIRSQNTFEVRKQQEEKQTKSQIPGLPSFMRQFNN
jgi:cell division protein FtsZ